MGGEGLGVCGDAWRMEDNENEAYIAADKVVHGHKSLCTDGRGKHFASLQINYWKSLHMLSMASPILNLQTGKPSSHRTMNRAPTLRSLIYSRPPHQRPARSTTERPAQVPLATVAKPAGIQRFFLPCAWIPVIPAGGIPLIRDHKEMGLVVISFAFRKLLSGRGDYAVLNPEERIPGGGNVPSALTGWRDMGRYAAKVIVGERTLNKHVLVYNEMRTPLQLIDSDAELKKTIEGCGDGMNMQTLLVKIPAQYLVSWGIPGDSRPDYAKYLGYMSIKGLCSDFEPRTFEDYAQNVVGGKAPQIYEELKARLAEMMKK
ncbi:uncharacterized protein MYCFIDRAFT_174556 [Pseudocercospora fijiensis CIRAD86]|uniref:NmrA-like domain-containing protein n=1 Tax=Pseudocercospora fijiensis (strain CIRAD86) TaxID=383855 RepID=M3B105_PSEFD|nr:uncharacterized protein MYCFIDRAFT_174556 [Pseudocercospora fijiensis CIRAD86]EME83078.1 hypothetical protein MYCFIDRAFT_174556 [Pseudocercospora fijiensis CIRAD86]